MKASSFLTILAITGFAIPSSAQTVSPLISISPAEFLKLPDGPRAVYVGGVIDGITFTTYGYSIKEHDKFAHCARTLTLGALAQRTAAWLKANPSFSEGTASAIAQTMGAYCREKGLRSRGK